MCHKCDVPACVNPDHLFIGSSDDNNKDRAAKGRTVTRLGEVNNMSKLSEDDVRTIRDLYTSGVNGVEIAKRFPVNHCAIYDIINNKTWRARQMNVTVLEDSGYDLRILGMAYSYMDRSLSVDEWWIEQKPKAENAALLAQRMAGTTLSLKVSRCGSTLKRPAVGGAKWIVTA